MNPDPATCYKILGLPFNASLREIKKAYRALVKKWHPDLSHGAPAKQREGEERLKLINAAYDILESSHVKVSTQTTGAPTQQQNEENRRAKAAYEAKQREEYRARAEQEARRNEENQKARAANEAKQHEEYRKEVEKEAKRNAKRKEKARGRQLRKMFSKFQELAKRGNAEAQYRLAMFYRNGQGCVRDKAEASRWFKKAAAGFKKTAAGGDSRAMFYLGFAFAWGIGVATDLSQAIKWYEAAAEKGLSEANFHLGFMYYFGFGINQDFDNAAKLYQKAIEQGYKVSGSDDGDYLRVEPPRKYFKHYRWYVSGVQRATFK